MSFNDNCVESRLVCLVQRLLFMKENSPFSTRSQKFQVLSGTVCMYIHKYSNNVITSFASYSGSVVMLSI